MRLVAARVRCRTRPVTALYFCSDSQGALQALSSSRPRWRQIHAINKHLYRLTQQFPELKVNFSWVTAHTGIRGNEMADSLAASAHKLPLTNFAGDYNIRRCPSRPYAVIKSALTQEWQHQWFTSTTNRALYRLFPIVTDIRQLSSFSSRAQNVLWNRFLSNHLFVQAYLYRFVNSSAWRVPAVISWRRASTCSWTVPSTHTYACLIGRGLLFKML